ncbi:6-hydroxy-D-nicotine oxidase [Fusarium beomiforme]|uniref:6-hydroxy-D-nicotine oxidase n=1 Tax=Fusarium beomiforme TaxID=44412 RepID=A0A9P5ANT8_9HYPO|nr:6-hydroxy-D-nicotine oxidase [Fusarium beomiforme]
MATSCEIPQGREISNSIVNDDLPTADALKIADEIEVFDGKGEKHTFKSIYNGPGRPRRVLVVFVRHFFCCSCVSYTSFLAKNATPEKLKEINTEIVIIGHGDPGQVDMYRIDTGCEFPIYTDPSEELYKTLGMIRTWEEGPANKYIPYSSFWVAWASMKNAFWKLLEGYPLWNWGTTNQQGGEFLFEGEGEDKTVTWCHRMRNSRDHTDTDEILEVLGLAKDGDMVARNPWCHVNNQVCRDHLEWRGRPGPFVSFFTNWNAALRRRQWMIDNGATEVVIIAVWLRGLSGVYDAYAMARDLGLNNLHFYRHEVLVRWGIDADSYRILTLFHGIQPTVQVRISVPHMVTTVDVPPDSVDGIETRGPEYDMQLPDITSHLYEDIYMHSGTRNYIKLSRLVQVMGSRVSPIGYDMEFIAAGASWALGKTPSPQKILSRLGLASLVAQDSWPELSAKLSPQASIVLPDDSSFGGLVSRWRDWHGPQPGAVVRYANDHGIPFLARSGGHGATEALQLAKDVIVVDMRGQDVVEIAEDGKSARIGGGASVKKVVNELWAAGKQTVTGICECVGVSAPVLGGGHGWLQGQYGLAADQVISARVVLPDGEVVTASEDSNPDMFWALRGAGHNFGIVTEWQYRIYNINNLKWSYEIFIFLGDKLEEVLALTNKMMKTQPPHLTHWMYIVNIPEIDPDKPIIWYAVISDSDVKEAREYAKPLHDLGPLNVNTGEASMPELADITLMGDDSVGCAKGFTGLRYPIGLKTYDLLAVRKVFNEIADMSKRVPELAGSFFLLEGYSTHGVKKVDAKSSAFPHRDDEILVTPYILYKPNATLNGLAQEHGEKLRRHLLEASGDPEHLRAYVNYAHGTESLEDMYGHEAWRIEKLKSLKKKWDPKNRMRFYAPIV